MTVDPAAEVARIEAERAKLPKDERQRLEAADAPLLRIQLLYILERAKKAEAIIERVEAYAHELRHKDAMGLLAAIGAPASCAECGHPKADHQDADEPVSVGLCQACDAADSDDAHHNYEPADEERP